MDVVVNFLDKEQVGGGEGRQFNCFPDVPQSTFLQGLIGLTEEIMGGSSFPLPPRREQRLAGVKY